LGDEFHWDGGIAIGDPGEYDWRALLLSLVVAIFTCGLALSFVFHSKAGWVGAAMESVVVGSGILVMCYLGMASMRLAASWRYSISAVAAAVFVAMAASVALLLLGFAHRSNTRETTVAKLMSTAVIGGLISLVNHVAMTSASFVFSRTEANFKHAASISSFGMAGIAVGAIAVEGMAILTSTMDRRIGTQVLESGGSEQLRQIADHLPVALGLANADLSKFLFINRAFEKISGRSVEDLLADAMTFVRGVHEEDQGRLREALEGLVKGEPIREIECRVVRPDGTMAWALCGGFLVLDERGRIIRLVGFAVDITALKRAEDEVRRSTEQYRVVAEMAVDAMLTIDEESRIQYCNPATKAMFGYEMEELQGRRLTMLMPERLWTKHIEGIRRYVTTGVRHVNWNGVEMTARRKNGEEFPVEVAFAEMVREGRHTFTGYVKDITERKRALEEIHRLSGDLLRMQDAERRKIASDLHDSTGQVLVALASALAGLKESVPANEREARSLIAQCAGMADQAIREVRTLSYLLYPPELENAGLVEAIRGYVAGFVKRSGTEIILEISPNVGRMETDVELALFRVVQESLPNIHRHSGGRKALIRIHRETRLVLEIVDIGGGKTGREEGGPWAMGVGIRSMQERVKSIGGEIEIYRHDGGNTVRVVV
jgi:PAS domain S-box-containing protein